MKNKKFKLLFSLVLILALSIVLASVAFAADGEDDAFVPDHAKSVTPNKDGTYQIELSVTGDADAKTSVQGSVNVLVVYDTSSSMTRERTTYNGNSVSRADASEKVIYDFAKNLFAYKDKGADIEMALVTFDYDADATQPWTSTESAITGKLSSDGSNGSAALTYNQGTNWDAGLQEAVNQLSKADKDTTFVIFVTDGSPSKYMDDNGNVYPQGTGWNAFLSGADAFGPSQDDALHAENYDTVLHTYNTATTGYKDNTTLYGIFAFGNSTDDYLDDVIYFAKNGVKRSTENGNTNSSGITDYYYNASDASALDTAVTKIFNDIADFMGIAAVSMEDGTTSNVKAESGEIVADLLDIDTNSYKYWLSIPVVNNKFSRMNSSGQTIEYTVTPDTEAGTCTVTWGTAPDNKSVTVTGSITGGNFKYQWTGSNDLYEKAPPAASLSEDGSTVKWDLSSVGTLLDGVTYSVTFDVWPSQTTLDYIADIKNDPSAYSKLPEEVQKYFNSDGTLKTNTGATLNYTDTRTDDGPQSEDFVDPKPVSSQAVEQLAVSKVWENSIDDRNQPPVKFNVTRDGAKAYEVELSSDNSWHNTVYISVGIMRTHGNDVELLAEGHDFTFTEPQNITYHWELDVPTVRPMIIDGTETSLIKVDAKHPAPAGQKTYSIKGATYYVAPAGTNGLTATNYRRSSIILTKTVEGENVPADATFPVTLNIKNALAPASEPQNDPNHDSDYWVWVSVRDKDGNKINEGAVVSGATPSGNNDGWYIGVSETPIVLNIKDGYSIRINNLPTGSTYNITEGELTSGFKFIKATGERSYKEIVVDEDGEEQEVDRTETAGTASGQSISGTVEYNNSLYTFTITNEYALVDVTADKVWSDNSDQNELRPSDLTLTLNGLPQGVTSTPTVTKSEDGNTWTYTWTGVPKYDGQGKVITYTVSEDQVPSGYTASPTTPVQSGGTITNTLDAGTLTIKKSIELPEGAGNPADITFTVTDSAGATYATVKYSEMTNGEKTLENVPAGSYTITEDGGALAGYTMTSDNPNGVSIKLNKGDSASASFTNTYSKDMVKLTLEKKLADDSETVTIPADTEFTISGTTVSGDEFADQTYKYSELPKTIDVPAGTYSVTEDTESAAVDGYTLGEPQYSDAVELKTAGATGTLTVTNTYSKDIGNLTITKTIVKPADAGEPAAITFTVTGPEEYSETFTYPDDFTSGSKTIEDLPVGDYKVSESGGALAGYKLTANPEGEYTATVENGGTATAAFTNTYEKKIGEEKFVYNAVNVTKVDQDDEPLEGATFTLTDAEENEVKTYSDKEFDIDTEELKDYLPEAGESITLTLTESAAPQGYEGDTANYDVVISAEAVEALDEESDTYVTTTTYTITIDGGEELEVINTQKTGEATEHATLTVNKTDAEDGSALSGATFALTDEDGNSVATATSDDEGVAEFLTSEIDGLPTEDGASVSFTLKETAAPSGYVLNEDFEETVTISVSVSEPTYDEEEDAFITTTTYTINGDSEYSVDVTNEKEETPPDKPHYILHYESNGGTEYPDEEYPEGQVVNITYEPIRPGYTFEGWYADPGFNEPVSQVVMDRNHTVYAKWSKTPVPGWLDGDNHIAYLIGYPDGLIQPHWNITRAEVATIFFRLLKEEVRQEYLTSSNSFGDVEYGQWFNTAISTVSKMGIVKGYPDGNFHPNANITRAEFAAIAARFDQLTETNGTYFSDIDGHWAKREICLAAHKGWITGYPDGTFRPDNLATRAEVAALINRVLIRDPQEPEDLLEGMVEWPDNMDTSAWYYMDLQESSNTHEYERVTKPTEKWTVLLENPDWTIYNH